jgi:hypothetical protein
VLAVYDGAKVDVTAKGLSIQPSLPAVPATKTFLQGTARLVLAK